MRTRLAQLARVPRPSRARRGERRGEDGFILLESLIAISLITVVMGALASLTLNVVTGTTELRARQGATQLATSAMATIGSVPATDLLTGRDSASVASQFSAASGTPVAPWLTAMTQVSDNTQGLPPGSGATAAISTSPTLQTLNGVAYRVSTYLGGCALRDTGSTDCVVGGTKTPHLRAVVAVTWSGRGCRAGTCSYVTATLINTNPDPIFNTNRANPPTRPVVTDPGAQVSTVGTVTSLQLAVDPGTGLAPFTWQLTTGTLPTGLSLSADGLVSGTPTALVNATPLTVTVRDVFSRPATGSFTWSVVAAPTITSPGDQSTVQGQTVSLPIASTCPNTPCTFTVTGAPAGLTIDAGTGRITGSPTTVGTSSVTVTVTDADGATATTTSFTWRVLSSATIGAPGTLRASVGTAVSVPVAYTCPVGPCTVTLSAPMPGVGLSAGAVNTTNNSTLTLTRPAGPGTVYLAGTVQPTAVDPGGTSKAHAPVLSITGPGGGGGGGGSAPGSWTAYNRPTVGPVGTRTVTVGATRTVDLPFTCPNVSCTLTLTNPVPGLGLSTTSGVTTANNATSLTVTGAAGTVYISGRVTSAAVPSGTSRQYPLTVTITDAGTANAASGGTWTATTAPKITNPGSQAAEPDQDISLQLTAVCPNGGCTWRAEAQVSGDPRSIPIPISTTGLITYRDAPQGSFTVRVTVTDADQVTDTVEFQLTVQTFSLAIANRSSNRPNGNNQRIEMVDVAGLVRPVADGYTYQLFGAPSWLTIGADGVLTARLTKDSNSDGSITVRVTSTASSTSFVEDAFAWTVQ